ncbi:Zinc transporter [Lecanora helva]
MLPSAQKYLIRGGLSSSAAAYATIGCFLAGVIGIRLASHWLHRYIPSHVVDCDHSHDEDENDENKQRHYHDGHDHDDDQNGHISEGTPLLSQDDINLKSSPGQRPRSATAHDGRIPDNPYLEAPALEGRPTLKNRLTTRVTTLVSGAKNACNEDHPCYGYSNPCGQDCFKALSRKPTATLSRGFGRLSASDPGKPSLPRTVTTPTLPQRSTLPVSHASMEGIPHDREEHRGRLASRTNSTASIARDHTDGLDPGSSTIAPSDTANDASHHHHVPTNVFLSIGLQTSIAIALHKLPEGFITYATNHANPKLGFSVFMALFIHNITEGFAMALPLYLAIQSRWQAMFWSSLLGGVSQPLGAGVAALWFKIAGRGDAAPGEKVYGCMFAITAGIMASVALSLFSESLSLTHSRGLCTAFAFIGMGILGVSYALTA